MSHLAVDAFVLVAVPWLYVKQGWMGLLKYWLLPLLFAHLNAGSLLTHKPAGAFLFPEIGESAAAPLYALEQWMPRHCPVLARRRGSRLCGAPRASGCCGAVAIGCCTRRSWLLAFFLW